MKSVLSACTPVLAVLAALLAYSPANAAPSEADSLASGLKVRPQSVGVPTRTLGVGHVYQRTLSLERMRFRRDGDVGGGKGEVKFDWSVVPPATSPLFLQSGTSSKYKVAHSKKSKKCDEDGCVSNSDGDCNWTVPNVVAFTDWAIEDGFCNPLRVSFDFREYDKNSDQSIGKYFTNASNDLTGPAGGSGSTTRCDAFDLTGTKKGTPAKMTLRWNVDRSSSAPRRITFLLGRHDLVRRDRELHLPAHQRPRDPLGRGPQDRQPRLHRLQRKSKALFSVRHRRSSRHGRPVVPVLRRGLPRVRRPCVFGQRRADRHQANRSLGRGNESVGIDRRRAQLICDPRQGDRARRPALEDRQPGVRGDQLGCVRAERDSRRADALPPVHRADACPARRRHAMREPAQRRRRGAFRGTPARQAPDRVLRADGTDRAGRSRGFAALAARHFARHRAGGRRARTRGHRVAVLAPGQPPDHPERADRPVRQRPRGSAHPRRLRRGDPGHVLHRRLGPEDHECRGHPDRLFDDGHADLRQGRGIRTEHLVQRLPRAAGRAGRSRCAAGRLLLRRAERRPHRRARSDPADLARPSGRARRVRRDRRRQRERSGGFHGSLHVRVRSRARGRPMCDDERGPHGLLVLRPRFETRARRPLGRSERRDPRPGGLDPRTAVRRDALRRFEQLRGRRRGRPAPARRRRFLRQRVGAHNGRKRTIFSHAAPAGVGYTLGLQGGSPAST